MENDNVSTTKVEEPVQVTMKNPKKVKQGKRLAGQNRGKKEEQAKTRNSEPKLSQAYSVGAVIAAGVLGLLGYCIYQSSSPSKKGDNNFTKMNSVRSAEVQTQNEQTSSKWSNLISYCKMDKRVSLITYTKQC